MTICITIPQCEQWAKDQGYTPLILNPDLPWMASLAKMKEGDEFTIASPTECTEQERQRFVTEVYECLLNLEITRNTFAKYKSDWEENSFWNHDAAMRAKPVNQLPQYPDQDAIIIGAGPSNRGFNAEFGISYCAWSAISWVDLNGVDYIGHCDHRGKNVPTNRAKALIFTPYCHPDFLNAGKSRVLKEYVYLDRGNPWAERFARKRNIAEHTAITGNVVDMLAKAAIYAGHKKIRFIGVDLCCKTPEEVFQYHPTTKDAIPAQNYRGEQVWTDEIFITFQRGLEELVWRNPGIEFSNLGEKGVIIEGIPYDPC